MSSDKAPKKKKITIIKLTVANGETVKPGQVIEVDVNDAKRLVHHGKAVEGDVKVPAYVGPKKQKKASSEAPASEDKK